MYIKTFNTCLLMLMIWIKGQMLKDWEKKVNGSSNQSYTIVTISFNLICILPLNGIMGNGGISVYCKWKQLLVSRKLLN